MVPFLSIVRSSSRARNSASGPSGTWVTAWSEIQRCVDCPFAHAEPGSSDASNASDPINLRFMPSRYQSVVSRAWRPLLRQGDREPTSESNVTTNGVPDHVRNPRPHPLRKSLDLAAVSQYP